MYEDHGTALNFVHRRIISGLGGALRGGISAFAGGAFSGGGGGCGPGMVMTRGGGCSYGNEGLGLSGRGGGYTNGDGRDKPGRVAAVQKFLPGGATGTYVAGEAVMGQWGAALEPQVVGEVERKDGTTGPILRCIRGMVLGTDDLCYNKPLANGKRKWPRGTPPFLTGGDVKCLRTANRLRSSKHSSKLLKELGFR